MSDAPVSSKPPRLTAEERLARLEACTQVRFKNQKLAHTALTHKSWCNEHKGEEDDNERLEFLGDAAVDLAVGQRLMERFPTASEGELSKLRALIVNEEGLARVARTIGLGDLLLLGRGEELTGGREKSSLLADSLEAVLAAIYLGNGIDEALAFVDRFFGDALDGVADGKLGRDNKSLLQEAAQSRLKANPRYRVVNESGPEHEKIFEVEVSIAGEQFARSTGRSKKEAEQAAAEKTLEMLSARG
ncbi:MAG: ribonuclease III [Myxococcaceae bacterium]